MDTPGIRTSFIPKTSMTKAPAGKREGLGFMMFLGITILIVSLFGWLAAYGYKSLSARGVVELEQSLAQAKEAFEPGLLKVFENLDRRLHTGQILLDQHNTAAPLFGVIDELTLKSIRYNNFALVSNISGTAVRMSGEALDFQAIALQALAFSKDERLSNPIFSNLGVESSGHVTFDVSFNVEPSLILYSPRAISQLQDL